MLLLQVGRPVAGGERAYCWHLGLVGCLGGSVATYQVWPLYLNLRWFAMWPDDILLVESSPPGCEQCGGAAGGRANLLGSTLEDFWIHGCLVADFVETKDY